MEALIIAAGLGSRMSRLFSPKPLTPIYGLRLIERIILTGKMAGIRDFKIVVGYKADKIKAVLGDGAKYGVRIRFIDNPEWQKGNGISVLKAKDEMHGKFLLLMSDHLFDREMLKKLATVEVEEDHCLLCVDKNLSGDHFELDDVTKVYYEDDKIRKIDKDLQDFNGIDTGVFLCTPAIFEALEQSVNAGQYSLSAGNQVLAEQGKLGMVDTTGSFWVDVDDEVALQRAKKQLVQQLFKPTDGPISRNFNRRLSTRLSTFLAGFNISPNSLTLASFGLSIVAAILFYLGGYVQILLAGVIAQLSSILDGCDGEVARLKFKFSAFGEWLDKVLDRYSDGLIILGITHALWLSNANDLVWLAGFFALTGSFINSYTAGIYDNLLRNNLLRTASLRIGRDVRLFIILLGALANQLLVTLAVLAAITNFEAIRRLFILKNAYKVETANL